MATERVLRETEALAAEFLVEFVDIQQGCRLSEAAPEQLAQRVRIGQARSARASLRRIRGQRTLSDFADDAAHRPERFQAGRQSPGTRLGLTRKPRQRKYSRDERGNISSDLHFFGIVRPTDERFPAGRVLDLVEEDVLLLSDEIRIRLLVCAQDQIQSSSKFRPISRRRSTPASIRRRIVP